MSQEAFKTHCGDLYNSNLFGEDLSQIVQTVSRGEKIGQNPQTVMQQTIKKAQIANINNSQFFSKNKEWLVSEIENYLDQNQIEINLKRVEEKESLDREAQREREMQEMEVSDYLRKQQE